MKLMQMHTHGHCAQLYHYLSRALDKRCFARHVWVKSHYSTSAVVTPVPAIRPFTIAELTAPDLAHAKKRHHVDGASHQLEQHGILKISLGFQDPYSQYLKQLVLSLHEYHDHQLPISHSASCGWFWDVRPTVSTPFQTPQYQARSETAEPFPWHTDCSYEYLPPRYFALHVLQHDRLGGGSLAIMNVQKLTEMLSPDTQLSLMRSEFRFLVPPEFTKEPAKKEIVGSVLASQREFQPYMMRFRRDIIVPMTERASRALQELDTSLNNHKANPYSTLYLRSSELPAGSIILVDNRRWLHARGNIKDPERHLRRVRWDAIPFSDGLIE